MLSAPCFITPTTIRRPGGCTPEGGRAFVSVSLRPFLIAALLGRDPGLPAIVVAGDDRQARELASSLRAWLRPAPRALLPEPWCHLRVAPGASRAPDRAADRGARCAARGREAGGGGHWSRAGRHPGRGRQRGRALGEGSRPLASPAWLHLAQGRSARPRRDRRRPRRRRLRACRPGRRSRSVRDPRRPARPVPLDRGSRRSRRPVRRRDRVAALVQHFTQRSLGEAELVEVAPAAELAAEYRELAEIAAAGGAKDRPDIAELLPVEDFKTFLELIDPDARACCWPPKRRSRPRSPTTGRT